MKTFRLLVVLVLLSPLMIRAEKEITLLLVPRADVPVKIGMDVGSRMPTLLLTYQVNPGGTISLHGWNGTAWVGISGNAYAQGNFFSKAPTSAVIVGAAGDKAPDALIPSAAWCPEVYRINTLDPRALLHLIGSCCDFKYSDWKWFSQNYGYAMKHINPDGLNIAWYQQRLDDNLAENDALAEADLKHLVFVRAPQVSVEADDAEPEDLGPEADPVDEDDSIASEEAPEEVMPSVDVPVENPFTNAIAPAIVFGADEETVPEEERTEETELAE